MILTTDNWVGVKANLVNIQNPSWQQIEDSLRALDQKARTQVVLKRDDLSNISIGGGLGKYHVSVVIGEEDFFVIDNVSDRRDKEQLIIGGQLGKYPSQNIVHFDIALRVIRAFFQDGKLDDSVSWSRF